MTDNYLIHSEFYEDGEMISQELVYETESYSDGVVFMVDNAHKYPHPHGAGSTLYMTHPKS